MITVIVVKMMFGLTYPRFLNPHPMGRRKVEIKIVTVQCSISSFVIPRLRNAMCQQLEPSC
jgi:hypothetical protein